MSNEEVKKGIIIGAVMLFLPAGVGGYVGMVNWVLAGGMLILLVHVWVRTWEKGNVG